MSWLEVLAVIGIIGFVIYQQFAGQLLRGKRVVLLPAILTVVGFLNLRGHHLSSGDITWLAVGAAGSLAIGLAFGVLMRLEARDGVLWGKLPLRGLWLWVALIAWRVAIMVVAARTGAHVAASTTPLLFTLGLNRVGQAAVIVPRAMLAGIPFAPEKDGRTFMGDRFSSDRLSSDRLSSDRFSSDRLSSDRLSSGLHGRDRDRSARFSSGLHGRDRDRSGRY